MGKKNTSSEEQKGFRIAGKLNLFFIILISLSAVPIAIGFIGIFDQFTQPIILNTTITGSYDAEYTINLESNSIYYITISQSDLGTTGDFTGILSFLKGTEEIYHDSIQHTIRDGQKGMTFAFNPFVSDTEGAYIINCTITYTDITYPFYIKMQRAAGIAQITGYSGEEILNVGMIIFLAVIVLLIIVSIIARVKYAVRLGRLSAEPEQQQSNFVWKSKDEKEDS